MRRKIQTLDLRPILKDWVSDESGATAIEYGLIAALVALSIISGASAFSDAINTKFNGAADVLNRN